MKTIRPTLPLDSPSGSFSRLLFKFVAVTSAFLFPLTGTTSRANESRGDSQREASTSAEKTLAPYFLVQSADSNVDSMPLKSTSVDVKIAGVIADVHVTQIYSNAGGVPLEAVYVFPGSTRAAVYGMQMRIADRVLTAKIQEKGEARKTYEEAKSAGKRSSLLEQQRPNVFQMNVANILPGDTVTVDLRYTELLTPEEGVYGFVFPTVVGPRYSNRPEGTVPPSERWVNNPYLSKGKASPSTFDIKVDLATGIPIQDLRCTSHDVKPEFLAPAHALVTLNGSGKPANDRDYILTYRLADQKIQSGLLISRGEKENFFTLIVEPPKRVTPQQIPPREYNFVVDVSGSMEGFPLETAKAVLKKLLGTLRPTDSFNVLQFSGGSKLLAPRALPASAENIQRACNEIDQIHGGGGTELLPALKEVFALPSEANFSRSVVVITDGFIDCEPEVFDLIRSNLNHSNLFAFGIGSSVNRFLIEGMARAGQGEPFVVTGPGEVETATRKFISYVSSPVLTHIEVTANGFEAYDVEPATVPDVLSERPVIIFGKWRGWTTGELLIKGLAGDGEYVNHFPVTEATEITDSLALTYLWARSRIATLGDYAKLDRGEKGEVIRQITSLGLSYNLLTAYTSFVAVDDLPTATPNTPTAPVTVKQPLPLPAGVANSAVGGTLPTTPEPETWAMMAILAGILGSKFLAAKRAQKW